MGKAAREKPKRLAEKLLRIRTMLEVSQSGLIERLGISDRSYRNYVSDFENGIREPSLPVLLKYARLAGVYVDVLIDDELELPTNLPSPSKYKAGLRKK